MTGITLYTTATPNGFKASIALEELKAAGLIPGYEVHPIAFKTNDQKKDFFLKINPNGRIPAIVDDRADKGPINVWESASILLYLAKTYDTNYEFHFKEADLDTEMLNWIFFIQGGVGPMQGQANHFHRYAPEKIEYGIKRYQGETSRLYSVYEDHLKNGREYLVGEGKGKYSFADICTFPWIRTHAWAGVSIDPFPHLKAWLDRIAERPAVKVGITIPDAGIKADITEEEAKKASEESRANFGFKKDGAFGEEKK